jgi:hypothetical protein
MSNTAPSSSRTKNRAWIWFFAFLAVASVGVAAFMIVFNLRLQLKPEQLDAAMERWRQHGPADYQMTFTRRINQRDTTDTFKVTVRNRRVIEVRLNGELLRDEDNKPYPAGHERLQWYTMEKLLREIEVFLDNDAKEGKKNYNVAIFDEETGALRKYLRSVRGGERVDEEVKVEPLANMGAGRNP